MNNTISSHIAFAFLADAHKMTTHGKKDAIGIFTHLGVFALPATREFSIVLGVTEVAEGTYPLSFWLRHGRRRARKVAVGTLNSTVDAIATVLAERIKLSIDTLGGHSIGVCLGSGPHPTHAYWTPLHVEKLPWPEQPSGSELSRLLKDSSVIRGARAELVCNKCRKKYVFEVDLDPAKKPRRGVLRFPPDGQFECRTCGQVHFLKDVEGQVRSQLGKSLSGDAT